MWGGGGTSLHHKRIVLHFRGMKLNESVSYQDHTFNLIVFDNLVKRSYCHVDVTKDSDPTINT